VRWASVSSLHLFVEKKLTLFHDLPQSCRTRRDQALHGDGASFVPAEVSKVLVAASLSMTACGRHGLLCILVDVETVLAVRGRAKCSRSPFAGDAKANRTENGAQIGVGQNSAA
jgi:hypothetical protein